MRRLLRLASAALLTLTASGLVGCSDSDDNVSFSGTLHSDGYALFAVDNDKLQTDEVIVTVHDVEPDATYVLLYTPDQPKNAGWFLFDPNSVQRCGGSIGDHCLVPNYGYLVDWLKTPAGATSLVLRDTQCECNPDDHLLTDDWTGHWAVMRVERTDHESPITFAVHPHIDDSDFTLEPNVDQLQ